LGEREFGELEVGERYFNGRVRVPCAKGNNGTHRTLDSSVNFGSGEVPHLSSRTRLRATCHRRFSGKAPSHRTPRGSRGARTKRPSWVRGLWSWSGEYQRAMCKREITVPVCPI